METSIFRLQNNVDKAQNILILMFIEGIYMSALTAKYVADGNLSSLEVVNHLKINYYKIIPVSLKENAARTTSAYDVNKLFETVIDQIKTAVNFDDAGRVPYNTELVATTAHYLIFLTGSFNNS